MKVTQEKLPASQIGLSIEIEAENTKQKYENKVTELKKTINIPGFRKGKIPRHMLIQRLGKKRVTATVLDELIQESVKKAIEDESIEALGNYQLKPGFEELIETYKPGEPFNFQVAIDVPPDVEVGDYKNISVSAEETKYDDKQIDDFLAARQKEKAILVPIENRPAQLEDVTVIDYQAYNQTETGEKGDEIPNIGGKDFQVELVEEKFIPGFVDGVVGMNLSETKELPITFPEDYPTEEIAGKPVVFEITLKEIKEKELPELDDDFAGDISEFETIEKLRENLETQFKEKAEKDTNNSVQEAIVAKLIETSTIELPETMIDKELDVILNQTAMEMQQYGVDVRQFFTKETIGTIKDRSRPQAIANLKKSLIISEIAKIESIEPDAEAIKEKCDEVKEELSKTKEAIDEARLEQMIKDDLLTEKTLTWLQEISTVELLPPGSKESTEEATEKTTEELENTEVENTETIEVTSETISEETSNPTES